MQEIIKNVGPKVESETDLLQARLKAVIHALSDENTLIPKVSKLSPEGIIELKALLEEIEKNVDTKQNKYFNLDEKEIDEEKWKKIKAYLHKIKE